MFSDWWNRFVASDPALRRLRTAVRVTLAAVATLLVMFPLLSWWDQPLSNAIVGAVVAVQSSVAVNDPTERGRRITTLLMPLPASASLLLATVTRSLPVVQILVFLAVIFVSTYVRRFGPRAFALGFVAFFGYFFATFLSPTLSQVPAVALSAVCGGLAAFVLRFALLRDSPEGVLDRGRRTLRAQVHGLLNSVGELARNPASAQRRRALHTRSIRLNETALMLEDTVQHLSGLTEDSREVLRHRLLEVELTAENLLRPLRQAIDRPGAARELPGVIAPLTHVLRSSAPEIRETGRRVADRIEHDGAPDRAMTVRRLTADLAELARATGRLGKDRFGDVDDTDPTEHTGSGTASARERGGTTDGDGDQSRDASGERTGLRRPEVRTAVQVTVAAGLAIAGGHLISPNRWYWAVITAFVVFVSANSRGELLVRAWQRTAGTMLGVVAGILVAANVTGRVVLEMGLIVACLFLAFYFLGYSYAVLTFFITTLLGIVYGLLGAFDVRVLEIRLAETAVGAAAGVLAAAVILPMRTRPLVRSRSQDFLSRLRDLLRETGAEVETSGTVTGMREGVRELDDRVQALLNSSRPLTMYRLRSQRGATDRWLTIVEGCAYFVRNLATALPPTVEMVDTDTRARLAELLRALADAAEVLATSGEATEPSEQAFDSAIATVLARGEDLHDIAESLPSGPTSLHHSVGLLDRVAQTLHDLGAEMGVATRTATRET